MARAPMNTPAAAPAAPSIHPILQGLVVPPTPMAPSMPASRGLAEAMPSIAPGAMNVQMQPQMPRYQMGGAIGPDGQPMRPAGLQQAAPQGPMDANMVEMQLQQFASQNPQVVAQIQQEVNAALMSGELTQQELNMLAQMAATALRSPELYPQLRQFAIQQGLATDADIPMEYDQGLVIAVLLAAQAAQANVGGQNMLAGGNPAMAGQAPIQSLKDGGRVRGGESEPVVIEAHTGEYVIPKHVVDMKGREFFDRMLEQYKDRA
jgi:hypothetical protein